MKTAKDTYNESMIKAIIFDADGPLYYRTPEIIQKKQALLAEFGYHGDIQQFEAAYEKEKLKGYVGAEAPEEMFQNIFRTIGLDLSRDRATTFANEFDAIQRQVTAVGGATATLKRLQNDGYKVCVLTDSFYSSEEKWQWFKDLGMDSYLDHIVSSDDIHKLKDTPDAYQSCLELLRVSADETVFVGHQEYEMVGARASRITAIALTPISTPRIHSDYAIGSLSELSDLLKKLTISK